MRKEGTILDVLREGSYTSKDIPQDFRVVFDTGLYGPTFAGSGPKRSPLRQLAHGELSGVKGISDKKGISISFFGVARDAMLVMRGPDVVRLNPVTKVGYDNPQMMMQDNARILKRIFQRRADQPLKDTQTVFKVFEYSFLHLPAGPREAMRYLAGHQTLDYYFRDHPVEINRTMDLARWAYDAVRGLVEKEKGKTFSKAQYWESMLPLSVEEWNSLILKGLEEIGRLYKDEGEWLIKGDSLKVPTGSRLFILLRPEEKSKEDLSTPIKKMFGGKEAQRELKIREGIKRLGLDKLYKVIFVDPARWTALRNQYFSKREAGSKKGAA